ncbi:transglutaminase family protein [Neiella sp. HB171785]|uniref:Transglutaminase family protein n=1 Tax=Neiella litorisoli TaxID=2771431 RepID=A0A8J6QHN8_9GAMM|nr:transglutaminase family protein [Neiella litorisoli]MBD1388692.1 transglutaminase family protein [Neiella litorisoli]
MTIRVAIQHATAYEFDKAVALSPHVIRLKPAPHSRTPIQAYSLKIEPQEHFINWQQDAFGNYLARVVFPNKAKRLAIEVEVIAEMTVINPFDFFLEEYAEQFPFAYPEQLKKDLAPYLQCQPQGKLFDQLLAGIDRSPTKSIDFLVAMNQLLERKINYCIRMEPGVQSPEQTLELASGSCRDSGWLLVQLFRHLGLAARFVSGYLVQLTADEKSLDGPSGPEQDFTDLHAWCEVYIPGAGWVGLDPTSGLFAGEGHIPLACTPDPISAAPIEGLLDPCEVTFEHSNKVTRIHEDPRVTKPYSDAQWQRIDALGQSVDEQLTEEDVRLTMGGEPTFVSIDDMESAQWNTEALGADKLRLAKTLLLKLRDQFAPQGLLHYGQGKWYPGEPVPRWALGLFWRKDGEPIWHNPQWLARIDQDYQHTLATARQFAQHLAESLALDPRFVISAYEDALHYLLEEQKLPPDIDSQVATAKDSADRKRLANVLSQGLNTEAGFVLPLAWDWSSPCWRSAPWAFRRDKLFLTPGDSPLGLRLPLDQLKTPEPTAQRDPMEPRESLAQQAAGSYKPYQDDGGPTIGTALCLQVRDGKLHLFLPPLTHLDHYVALIQTIEQVCVNLACPVVIEGYEPPSDPRLQKLLVTPDPGVIEVNVHPTASWPEQVDVMTRLYEAARQSRLSAEKFMLDGRHTGTGGGNHITLGGATPVDSPLLRRPQLLQSLITFWQHHPSLSYLFSGTFIGPTSQAPRVDEGRDEILYELEIAFSQLPSGDSEQPWLIDRVLRNLLIDITGNTHRAEFCIDKLYAPGSASGRLGLLELRGFEMPPHSRMALVQALLIRALLLRFWRQPYCKPLVRWGTLLHDKFMLPHFVWQDMAEVVADLNDHGIPFELDWLRPFEEFRFPHYGRVRRQGIEIELRWAIEPWHVLGEEVSSFGTARYVDSSVERVQVKVSGLTDGRYQLLCNGHRVPLEPTGKQGEAVAGVRYRAWAPPSALHPTIGVHTPLTFDLYDSWNNRAIGGCTYHVSHPGGRNYDTFPVNAFEAEARRVNRYHDVGHSQGEYLGPFTPRPEVDAVREVRQTSEAASFSVYPDDDQLLDYPHTLDLRMVPPHNG